MQKFAGLLPIKFSHGKRARCICVSIEVTLYSTLRFCSSSDRVLQAFSRIGKLCEVRILFGITSSNCWNSIAVRSSFLLRVELSLSLKPVRKVGSFLPKAIALAEPELVHTMRSSTRRSDFSTCVVAAPPHIPFYCMLRYYMYGLDGKEHLLVNLL